jgi:hypothetical protein
MGTKQIRELPEQTSPAADDVVVIQQAFDNINKKVKVSNFAGVDANAIHDNVAGEIAAITEKVTPVANDIILIEDSADSNSKKKVKISNVSGGGGSTEHNPIWKAGEFDYPASSPAPLDTDTGTNGTIKRQLFDDTTNETVKQIFKVPSDINSAGTVTFKLYGYAAVAAANDVIFLLQHAAAGAGESWDLAFTDESSGAKTCSATQDDIEVFTWTETVANLGWTAGDQVRIKITRDASNVLDTLVDDFGLTMFEIDIPRT